MGKHSGKHSHTGWTKGKKFRCKAEGCRKRAKDILEGTPLCRIHSPMRIGFETRMKLEAKQLKQRV